MTPTPQAKQAIRALALQELQRNLRAPKETDFSRTLKLARENGWKAHASREDGFGIQDVDLQRDDNLLRLTFLGGGFFKAITFLEMSNGERGKETKSLDEVVGIVGSEA